MTHKSGLEFFHPWDAPGQIFFSLLRFFIRRFRLSQLRTDIGSTQIQLQIELSNWCVMKHTFEFLCKIGDSIMNCFRSTSFRQLLLMSAVLLSASLPSSGGTSARCWNSAGVKNSLPIGTRSFTTRPTQFNPDNVFYRV